MLAEKVKLPVGANGLFSSLYSTLMSAEGMTPSIAAAQSYAGVKALVESFRDASHGEIKEYWAAELFELEVLYLGMSDGLNVGEIDLMNKILAEPENKPTGRPSAPAKKSFTQRIKILLYGRD